MNKFAGAAERRPITIQRGSRVGPDSEFESEMSPASQAPLI